MRQGTYTFNENKLYANADEETFWGIPLSVIDHLGMSGTLDPERIYGVEATEGGHIVLPRYHILPNYKKQQSGLKGTEVLPYLRKAFSGMLADARTFIRTSDKKWVADCMSQGSDVRGERHITGYQVKDSEQEWQEIVVTSNVSGKVVLFLRAQVTEKLYEEHPSSEASQLESSRP